MITIYGLTTCRQTQKALAWFKAADIAFSFHDYKKEGISSQKLTEWDSKVGYKSFLNTKGMSWRQLSQEEKQGVDGRDAALEIMFKMPRLIKRPAIEDGTFLYFGYDELTYADHFNITKEDK